MTELQDNKASVDDAQTFLQCISSLNMSSLQSRRKLGNLLARNDDEPQSILNPTWLYAKPFASTKIPDIWNNPIINEDTRTYRSCAARSYMKMHSKNRSRLFAEEREESYTEEEEEEKVEVIIKQKPKAKPGQSEAANKAKKSCNFKVVKPTRSCLANKQKPGTKNGVSKNANVKNGTGRKSVTFAASANQEKSIENDATSHNTERCASKSANNLSSKTQNIGADISSYGCTKETCPTLMASGRPSYETSQVTREASSANASPNGSEVSSSESANDSDTAQSDSTETTTSPSPEQQKPAVIRRSAHGRQRTARIGLCAQCSAKTTTQWRTYDRLPGNVCNSCGVFIKKLKQRYSDDQVWKIMQNMKAHGNPQVRSLKDVHAYL